MLFSDHPRTHYEKTLTHEVICQLRFPTILSINNVEPADFQERIREDFPQYARKQDILPSKVEPQPAVTNYHFLSQDGRWKLNLTKDFIALSTLSYPGWEEFARMLDKPLAAFIQLYKPAYFQRVGLRYLNVVSRKALDLGLRYPGEAGFQLRRQDPRRDRPPEDQQSQRGPGPGGEVYSGHGPVHGRKHPLRPGRRGSGDPPRPLLPGL